MPLLLELRFVAVLFRDINNVGERDHEQEQVQVASLDQVAIVVVGLTVADEVPERSHDYRASDRRLGVPLLP